MSRRARGGWVAPFCFIVAMLLVVVPLPFNDWLGWLRPMFPLLVVVYWSVALPERYGIWWAWAGGLLVDVLRGLPLGTHAFAFAVVAFAFARLSSRIKVYPMAQQCGVVGLMGGVVVVILRQFLGAIDSITAMLPLALLAAVTTALLWPVALGIQDRLRRRFHVG